MNKRINFGLLLLLSLSSCAEKKTRVWIDPPLGLETGSGNSQKLYYQIEDVQAGKKENLIIPLRQTPHNLVVEEKKKNSEEDATLSLVTQADKQIQDGKLAFGQKVGAPTVSYLRGLAEVEGLYKNKKYSEALVKIGPLIEQYPQQSRLFVMQGTLFRKIGERKLSLQAYKKAQELDRGNPAIEEAVLKAQDEVGGSI